MKILFYGTKPYDKKFFESLLKEEKYKSLEVKFIEESLTPTTAHLALNKGYEAVCAFVNMDLSAPCIETLREAGIKLILMRCAGFNNVDLDACKKKGITVMRVPSYSPEAVAEHAMALALTATRRVHKAYIKCRENNFNLQGLMGLNLYGKTCGVVGVGKIGAAFARIAAGFGMKVLGFDKYQDSSLPLTYTSLDELLKTSDLISLHCPLTPDTFHLINRKRIEEMKDDVILVNTSRGELVCTEDLIWGITHKKFFAIGLDVYEGESKTVYEDFSSKIVKNSSAALLTSYPNVVLTSHQAFFTKEAMEAISMTTLDNAVDFINGVKSTSIVE